MPYFCCKSHFGWFEGILFKKEVSEDHDTEDEKLASKSQSERIVRSQVSENRDMIQKMRNKLASSEERIRKSSLLSTVPEVVS